MKIIKLRLKTLLQDAVLKLLNLNDKFILLVDPDNILEENSIQWVVFRFIEALAHSIYALGYSYSSEEFRDAMNLSFDENWECYNDRQILNMIANGVIYYKDLEEEI